MEFLSIMGFRCRSLDFSVLSNAVAFYHLVQDVAHYRRIEGRYNKGDLCLRSHLSNRAQRNDVGARIDFHLVDHPRVEPGRLYFGVGVVQIGRIALQIKESSKHGK